MDTTPPATLIMSTGPVNLWGPAWWELTRPGSCTVSETWKDSNGKWRAGFLTFKFAGASKVKVPADLWLRFVKLAESNCDPDAIRAFAGRYGTLRTNGNQGEDIEDWAHYVNLCSAIWRVGDALRRGEKVEKRWLEIVRQGVDRRQAEAVSVLEYLDRDKDRLKLLESSTFHTRIKSRKQLIAACISKLLTDVDAQKPGADRCNYIPHVSWIANRLSIRPTGQYVLGAVILQLAEALGRPVGAQCSGCGGPCEMQIKATRGRRRYCDQCRKAGVPKRDAMRDLREREREIREGAQIAYVSHRGSKYNGRKDQR